MKKILPLLAFLLILSVKVQAETKLVKYKNFQIPITVKDSSDFRECTDGKPRIIVTTDINKASLSDPDDIQSMVHLLASSNQFKTLGLISAPGIRGESNGKVHIQNIVNAYALDFNRSNSANLLSLGYPRPSELTSVVRQGVRGSTNISATKYDANKPSHNGAKLILDEAQKVLDGTNCGPIYVLVWGSIPNLALALKESNRRNLGIEKALRVYFIANVNKTHGQPAYNYIFNNFLKEDKLWFIQSEHTFLGAFGRTDEASERRGEDTRQMFLDRISDPVFDTSQSCMSYVLRRTSDKIMSGPETNLRIKIGDTPSLLYVMNGDLDDPTTPSWGGQYKQVSGSTKWWIDRAVDNVDAIRATTTNTLSFSQRRMDIETVASRLPEAQNDWVNSMNRFRASLPRNCIQTVNSTLN